MRDSGTEGSFVGQVERDPQGNLWAVLYFRGEVVTRRTVTSLRRGKKCVSDLLLSAADNYPTGSMAATVSAPQMLAGRQLIAPTLPRAGLAPSI